MDLHAAQIRVSSTFPSITCSPPRSSTRLSGEPEFWERRGRRQPRRGEHQAVAAASGAARRQPGDRRQTPLERHEHPASEPDRCPSIRGKTALIFDDMISTGGSIGGAVNTGEDARRRRRLRRRHPPGPLRPGPRPAPRIADPRAGRHQLAADLARAAPAQTWKVVSVAPLLGEAIRRIHRHESVSYLFD